MIIITLFSAWKKKEIRLGKSSIWKFDFTIPPVELSAELNAD